MRRIFMPIENRNSLYKTFNLFQEQLIYIYKKVFCWVLRQCASSTSCTPSLSSLLVVSAIYYFTYCYLHIFIKHIYTKCPIIIRRISKQIAWYRLKTQKKKHDMVARELKKKQLFNKSWHCVRYCSGIHKACNSFKLQSSILRNLLVTSTLYIEGRSHWHTNKTLQLWLLCYPDLLATSSPQRYIHYMNTSYLDSVYLFLLLFLSFTSPDIYLYIVEDTPCLTIQIKNQT